MKEKYIIIEETSTQGACGSSDIVLQIATDYGLTSTHLKLVFDSLDEAIEYCEENKERNLYIISVLGHEEND